MQEHQKSKTLHVVIAVGAIIIVILLGLLFFLPTQKKSSTPASQITNDSNSVTVVMNEDGFSETEVTIKQGQTIIWQNNDQDFRWPASNVHPSHEVYPEFDPKEPIPPGESWSFTFDEAGEWQFHDHLKPYFTGTITVESST